MRMLAAIAVLAALLTGVSPAGAADIPIRIANATYVPSTVTARVGDVLVFVNEDAMEHAVFVPTVGFSVDLGNQKQGETRRLALPKAGRFEIECVPHGDMLLSVEVRP